MGGVKWCCGFDALHDATGCGRPQYAPATIRACAREHGAERDEVLHADEGADLPPSSLTTFVWRPDGSETLHGLEETIKSLADPGDRAWVDLDGSDEVVTRAVAEALGLPDLVTDDIVRRGKRAKLVRWDDILHVVVFTVHFDDGPVAIGLDIVIGRRFVLTSHVSTWRPVQAVVASDHDPMALLGRGVDVVLGAVLVEVVGAYLPVIDRVRDEIDTLEDAVLAGHDRQQLERLVRTRRWLLEARHTLGPMRDVLDVLAERELPMIDAGHRRAFRRVHDQVVHVLDELDVQREIVGGALDAYISGVNNSLAEVMKRLTAVTAVLAGVGAAAGIFGMSEAGAALGVPQSVGFWLVAAVMVLVGVVVFAYFRRIDWI